jgi:hypothetical protein
VQISNLISVGFCLILASCGQNGNVTTNPNAQQVSGAFSDIAITLPSIPNATKVERLEGLKGNHLLLIIKSDKELCDEILKSFSLPVLSSSSKREEVVNIPSKLDKNYQWHFLIQVEPLSDGAMSLRVEGWQNYD